MESLRLNSLWLKEALTQARKSTVSHKCGAVLVYRNKIVARGYNSHRCDRVYGGSISTNNKSCILCP